MLASRVAVGARRRVTLLNQPELASGVHQISGNRGRGTRTVAGVFDHDGERNSVGTAPTPYGANPANQECALPLSTSAVPVLPAIGVALAASDSSGAGRDDLAHVASQQRRIGRRQQLWLRRTARRSVCHVVQRTCGTRPCLAIAATTRAIFTGDTTTWPCP